MEFGLLATAALFVGYVNGANDNPKGVATLLGSGTASYSRALGWAAITTFGGCLGAIVISRGLFAAFSGQGLVPKEVAGEPHFLFAVGLAAAATVALATGAGLPVSTTHALIGALAGAGWMWAGSGLAFGYLGTSFLLPLAVSPLMAVALTVPVYWALRALRLRLEIEKESCLCIGSHLVPLDSGKLIPKMSGGRRAEAVPAAPAVSVRAGTMTRCIEHYRGHLWGLDAQRTLDIVHFASAGAVGFARGLNDAPKIAALLLAAQMVDAPSALMIVAVAMAAGGLLSAGRVAETMSYRITGMNAGQGFVGNLVTALLVTSASYFGLPVSTTHVSCGALFGIGAATGEGRWGTATTIVGAWLATLPLAALLGAAIASVLLAL